MCNQYFIMTVGINEVCLRFVEYILNQKFTKVSIGSGCGYLNK